MATPSRERQLVGNVWQYRTVEDGGGSAGGGISVVHVVVTNADIVATTPGGAFEGIADAIFALAEGDVLVAIGAYTTVSFDDSGLTGVDASVFEGTNVGSTGLNLIPFDLTNQSSGYTGKPGVGNAGGWDNAVSGGFATPNSYSAGLPFIAGAGGSDLSLGVISWNADGNTGQIDLYLTVATPSEV